MSTKKSHFKFSNGQRNGVFLLASIIIVLQAVYLYVDFAPPQQEDNKEMMVQWERHIDSIKRLQNKNQAEVLKPFNPNFITDYKGYRLGMSVDEIDRLLGYRAEGKWINSVAQFQEVTQVSDSLLAIISPSFSFPEWVSRPRSFSDGGKTVSAEAKNKTKSNGQKIDLNLATAEQLQKVYGIGPALSERIIQHRKKLRGGFISEVQLQDVYGLSAEVIARVLEDFTVKTPAQIEKININLASADQLVTIPHIDYEIAHYIIEQRTLRDGFKNLGELMKVKKFPIHKFEIIELYLTLK